MSSPPDPPKPPEMNTSTLMEEDNQDKPSFRTILLDKSSGFRLDKGIETLSTDLDSIHLSEEEIYKLHMPWRRSIIVKLFGRKLSHQYLKFKLIEMWKPSESLILIDLGCDFYTVYFKQGENTNKVLHQGLRFVACHFLTVENRYQVCPGGVDAYPHNCMG